MDETITYTSDNGYTGVLYGKKSFLVKKDNMTVFHTGSRNINTYEELVEEVEKFPEFMKMFSNIEKS